MITSKIYESPIPKNNNKTTIADSIKNKIPDPFFTIMNATIQRIMPTEPKNNKKGI